VHTAARIAAAADAGQILASVATLAATRRRFDTSEPQDVHLAGISEPVQVVTIDWS
jgi:class 3 adenylate cyclase